MAASFSHFLGLFSWGALVACVCAYSCGGDRIDLKSLLWILCRDWCYADCVPRPAVVCNVRCGNSWVDLDVNPPTNSCFHRAVSMTTTLPSATVSAISSSLSRGLQPTGWWMNVCCEQWDDSVFSPPQGKWLRGDWLTWWLNKWELMDREWYVTSELTQTNVCERLSVCLEMHAVIPNQGWMLPRRYFCSCQRVYYPRCA